MKRRHSVLSASSESDSEDEKSENNEKLLSNIREGAAINVIENTLKMKGVEINYRNCNGDTPLHLATKKSNEDILEFLLRNGANVAIKNKKGKTAVDLVKEKIIKKRTDPILQSIQVLLEQALPSTSGLKMSSKNTGVTSGQKHLKRLGSKLPDKDVSKKLRTDPSQDVNKLYGASGVKRALDGTIYQSKLLMLFVKRALKQQYDFRLATEMDAAEKFDDVVFKYRNKNKWTYRFLQAKHKQNPDRDKITAKELKTCKDENFSLQKYFVSYCSIKKNDIFKGGNFKDFIIVTNTDFDFEVNRVYTVSGEERKDSKERNDLKEKWQSYFTFESVPREDEILYMGKGEKLIRFKNDPGTIQTITLEIKSALEAHIKDTTRNNTLLELTKLQLALNKKTFKKNVSEFLAKLVFITNYPNEKKLEGYMREELGEQFELLNADLINDSFEKEMLDWLKTYENQEAPFYSWKDGEKFLEQLEGKINALLIAGLTLNYLEELKSFGIMFTNDLHSVENFLNNGTEQVLHISTQSTRLTAIKVLQSIESDKLRGKFPFLGKQDGFIFVRLETLFNEKTREHIIKSFSSIGIYPLVIIECEEANEQNTNFMKRFSDVLAPNVPKKIILISQDKDSALDHFAVSCQDVDDKINFENLDQISQKNLLTKEIRFQGNIMKLNDLINEASATNIVDHLCLLKFLGNGIIEIGDTEAFSSTGYFKDFYIDRKFHYQKIKIEILENKTGNEVFFISGASKEDLLTLIKTKSSDDLSGFEDYVVLNEATASAEENYQSFYNITSIPSKNMHWLEYHKDTLLWRASKGDLETLNKYIDTNFTPKTEDTKSEKNCSQLQHLGQKVVILANDPGVGKSTVITSLAVKMKEISPVTWIIRINLNDFTNKMNEICLDKVDHNWSTGDYIDFVVNMVFQNKKNNDLERRLFILGLQKFDDPNIRKPKIRIFFDGFDEISPTYKDKTLLLLKALETSDVCQIWITSRVHEKLNLEKQFETAALILSPLDETDQKLFLDHFWKWNIRYYYDHETSKICEKTEEAIHEYIKDLDEQHINNLNDAITNIQINASTRSIGEKNVEEVLNSLDFSNRAATLLSNWNKSISKTDEQFTQTPLNLRMLAEVVFEKRLQLPNSFELCDLYDEFIKMKFNIYHREKTNTSTGNVGSYAKDEFFSKILHRVHHEFAMKLFFPEEAMGFLQPLNVFGDEIAEVELIRVGLLILNGNQAEFIHRSFAEYFCSDYLIINLNKKQIQKLMFEQVLLKKDYQLIRKFINALLRKTGLTAIELTEEVKYSVIDHAQTIDEYTVLHVAAEECLVTVTEFVLKSFLGEQEQYRNSIFRTLLLNLKRGQCPLQIAVEKGSIDILHTILEFVRSNLSDLLTEIVTIRCSFGLTLLHYAALRNNIGIVKFVNNFVKENIPYSLKDLILATDDQKPGDKMRSPLHLAAEVKNGSFILDFLDCISCSSDITQELLLKSDSYGRTVLHTIASNELVETFTSLLIFVGRLSNENLEKMVLKTETSKGNTILHSIIKHPEMLEQFLDFLKAYTDVFKKLALKLNGHGQNCLHLAVGGSEQCLKILMKHLQVIPDVMKCLIASTNTMGDNAIHIAVGNDNCEVVKLLLKRTGAEYEILGKILLAENIDEKTPLLIAYEGNNVEIFDVILNSTRGNADLYKKLCNDIEKWNKVKEIRKSLTNRHTFYTAIATKNNEVVNEVLNQYHDYEYRKQLVLDGNDETVTPFDLAIEKDNVEVVDILLNMFKTDREVVKKLTLRSHIIVPNDFEMLNTIPKWIRNYYGDTALHMAIAKQNIKTVRILLETTKIHGDILKDLLLSTTCDFDGNSVLHMSAQNGYTEILKILLQYIIPEDFAKEVILQVNFWRRTSLHLAVLNDHYEIVELLLNSIQNYPDILQELLAKKDWFKNTALMLGCHKNRWKIVISLLSARANVNEIKEDHFSSLINFLQDSNDYTQEERQRIFEQLDAVSSIIQL